MANLYLKLENEDGSFREYRKDKIKAYWVKEGMKHSKKIQELDRKGDVVGVLEARLDFTCSIFGDKELTPDAILNGLESSELIPTLDRIFNTTMGYKEDTGDAPGKQ